MDERAFLETLKDAIEICELSRYFKSSTGDINAADSHYDIQPDLDAIAADIKSPGGIKGSHAQRRMLLVLVTLWQPARAQALFGEEFAALQHVVMAMDKRNRGLLAELLYTYPGWGD